MLSSLPIVQVKHVFDPVTIDIPFSFFQNSFLIDGNLHKLSNTNELIITPVRKEYTQQTNNRCKLYDTSKSIFADKSSIIDYSDANFQLHFTQNYEYNLKYLKSIRWKYHLMKSYLNILLQSKVSN